MKPSKSPLCFLLCATLLFSLLFLPGSAYAEELHGLSHVDVEEINTPGDEPGRACTHVWEIAFIARVGEWSYYSSTVHRTPASVTFRCSLCDASKTESAYINNDHSWRGSSSSCDGVTHRLTYTCPSCNGGKTTTSPCPNPSDCPGLPF